MTRSDRLPRRRPPPAGPAVIFDVDGVLVDSHPFHREAWNLRCVGITTTQRAAPLRALGAAVTTRDVRSKALGTWLGRALAAVASRGRSAMVPRP